MCVDTCVCLMYCMCVKSVVSYVLHIKVCCWLYLQSRRGKHLTLSHLDTVKKMKVVHYTLTIVCLYLHFPLSLYMCLYFTGESVSHKHLHLCQDTSNHSLHNIQGSPQLQFLTCITVTVFAVVCVYDQSFVCLCVVWMVYIGWELELQRPTEPGHEYANTWVSQQVCIY